MLEAKHVVGSTPEKVYSFSEYLAMENAKDHKSEYYKGQIIELMPGVKYNHGIITGNFISLFNYCQACDKCTVVGSEVRLYVPTCDACYYPDVMLTCGRPLFMDNEERELLNPTVIIEVLSKSAEHKDRNEKFNCYITIPSLDEYILVSQNGVLIEQYTRENNWLPTLYNNGKDSLIINNCQIKIKDIYKKTNIL